MKSTDSDHHVILRVGAKFFIPIITLYALYVQFHGDYGPGGGFQAGTIFAVGVILYALIFGLAETMRAVPVVFARFLLLFGFLLYAGVGVWTMINGGEYLDYDFLMKDRPGGHHGQHWGIILVELGVLFTVAGSLLTIFYAFAGRAPEIEDEDW